MRDQATTRKFSEPTLVSSAPAEAPARPKVLRRPAQFSSSATSNVITPIVVPPTTKLDDMPDVTPVAPRPAWQDDGRFAVMLLAIIILMNVVVVSWLGLITPAAPKPVITVQQQPSAVPTIPTKQRSVSVFSQSGEEEYERHLPPLNSSVDVHVLDSHASPISN